MPMGPSAFNPYWSGMQPGMEGYMPPYPGPMPYMGYGLSPLDIPFGGVMPPDPFGAQGYMMPIVPPQRYAVLCFGIFPLLSLWADVIYLERFSPTALGILLDLEWIWISDLL